MSFPRYPKYKESGVEWLGDVPEHWSVSPTKHLGRLKGGAGFPHENQGVENAELPFFKVNALGRADRDGVLPPSGDTVSRDTAKLLGAFVFPPRTLVFAKVGAALLMGRIRRLNREACIDNNMMGLVVREASCVGFVGYALNLVRFDLIANPGAVPSLNEGQIGEFSLPTPPLAEQVLIAAFLDRETAKIDGLVGEQERLMELLKEKRQAVITHAVTKGLDPDASMKPSGIEWLGDIPDDWAVTRLSPLSTKITNGYVGPTRDIFTAEGVRYLQSLHIKNNTIRFDVPYYVAQEWSDQHSKSILQTGDVLIVQTGDIGQAAVVPDEFAGCNCHALIIVAPVRSVVDGLWISWVLNSDYGYHSLLSIQTGALHPHLNCGDVKDIAIPLPPIAEQRRIVRHLVEQLRAFDALTDEAQHGIDVLQERRNALISAAVSGQIDVRGMAASDAT